MPHSQGLEAKECRNNAVGMTARSTSVPGSGPKLVDQNSLKLAVNLRSVVTSG